MQKLDDRTQIEEDMCDQLRGEIITTCSNIIDERGEGETRFQSTELELELVV